MRGITAATIGALLAAAPASAQSRFNAIWGAGPNDVWAAGDEGVVAHYTGQGWVSMRTGTTNTLRAIWASGPRDVWAVGDNGTIMRMNGTAWSYVRPLVRRDFIAVSGCGPNDVWVLGQSEDMSQPPALLHFDGTTWTLERTPFPFRPAGLSKVCVAASGSGGGGLTLAGTAYFDPTPQQRRDVGVLMRRGGSGWTTLGFDGRAMTDPQIGGAAWTGIATAGATTLLSGQQQGAPTVLMSRGGAWSGLPLPSVPNVEPEEFRFTLAGDGTPLALFAKGFARYTAGQWAVVTADANSGQPSAGDQAAYLALAQQIQAQVARGQQPSQQQIEQLTAMSQAMSGAATNMMAAAVRAQTLAFGRTPAVFAPTAATFFVAADGQAVMKVSGDSSEIVWNSMCIMPQMLAMEPCSNHAARSGSVPAAATGPQPEAPPEAAAPPPAAPNAPGAPRLPSVPRPRIPRP